MRPAGAPYVPAGDGGLVLGVRLGDPVFGVGGDHVAPGACLIHPDEAARHALALYACIGNRAVVRTGGAASATGAVRMRPGDQVAVRAIGQGVSPPWLRDDVTVMNIDPGLLPAFLAEPNASPTRPIQVSVRSVVPARVAGNGLGRLAASWDMNLQLTERDHPGLLLGDLVAVTDIDARFNLGYRRGWLTIGVIVHAASLLPRARTWDDGYSDWSGADIAPG